MIVKVQYRKKVHGIPVSDDSKLRFTISMTFRIPESRMKILYRGKIVSQEDELLNLVKNGKTLYLIGTPSKDQMDAHVKCKFLRRFFVLYVLSFIMNIFQMSIVQVPLKMIIGLLNGIKLFFVSMIRDPTHSTQEAANTQQHERQQ